MATDGKSADHVWRGMICLGLAVGFEEDHAWIGGMPSMRVLASFIAMGAWVFLCALNVAHGASVPVGGLEAASGMYLIGAWLGGRMAFNDKPFGEIYRLIKARQMPPMPPLPGIIQTAALIVAVSRVLLRPTFEGKLTAPRI